MQDVYVPWLSVMLSYLIFIRLEVLKHKYIPAFVVNEKAVFTICMSGPFLRPITAIYAKHCLLYLALVLCYSSLGI